MLRTLATFLLLATPAAAQPPVRVILWFDTEDYLLPASDDAALRLADWLRKEGVRATFKVVGEKARTLERRGRNDVIAALKKHEIGYHANYHSVPPTPAQYLNGLGWDDGVAEFVRREGPGVADVERIFGQKPSCYGQPGSSWGPQSYGAMKRWGMSAYLDSGRHVTFGGRPHYYCGLLTLYHLTHTVRADLTGPAALKRAEDRFLEARQQLHAEGGGVVSVYYHPCEFVHQQIWDGVNFRLGADPPRERWQLPPQKTADESRVAYETFEGLIRFIKRFPEVTFITASEAAAIYKDRAATHAFTPEEVTKLAANVGDAVNFQKIGDMAVSPAEVFALLTLGNLPPGGVLGPTAASPKLDAPLTVPAEQFRRATADAAEHVRTTGRVPPTVWLGSRGVSPEAFLAALARGVAGEEVTIKPATLATRQYVADDDPKLWGWVIFPAGFRAPALMEQAKWQAWTVKPALSAGR